MGRGMQIASATSVIPELAPVRWERDLSLTGRRAMTLRLNRAGNDELKTYSLVHCWDEMPRYMEYLRHITEGELLRKTAQGK